MDTLYISFCKKRVIVWMSTVSQPFDSTVKFQVFSLKDCEISEFSKLIDQSETDLK